MDKFFVGQLCRIIDHCGNPDPSAPAQVGREVRIVGTLTHPKYGFEYWDLDIDWIVRKDAASDVLSPIIPPGNAPSEFTYTELLESLHEMTGVAA